MALTWTLWKDVVRIQQAERSQPSLKPGERSQGVHLLQASLIINGFDVPLHGVDASGHQNNFYGTGTQKAVRECETSFGLTTKDSGIAGKEVVGRLDRASDTFYTSHAGHVGAALARTDIPLAFFKASLAFTAISALIAEINTPTPTGPRFNTVLVNQALNVHFRLLPPGVTGDGIRRVRTLADLQQIQTTFQNILAVFSTPGAFVDGVPFTGVKNPAESVPNSRQILFGACFRDFTAPFGGAIGKNSRAAILIHEGMHSVDTSLRSGRPEIHISEFQPTYDTQPANFSLLNPSSYASFAAHLANGSDPSPRFGLGAGQAN